ncbi:MAG: hypothetical protein JNM56_16525 [Planctomycetia bacterium]|nr:hypothetical protein [Planctomycetia bacterium]
MNCSEAQDRLQQRLDGEAVIDRAALDRHLAQCADCRSLHTAAGVLETGLRRLPSIAPPARLQEALIGSLLAERNLKLRRQRWRSVAALAAALLLTVGIGLYATGPEQVNRYFAGWFAPTLTTPAPVATTPATEPTPPEAPSIRDGVAGAGTAVVSLTLRTTEETVEQTRLLTGTLPSPTLNLREVLPPPQDQPPLAVWQETGQRVTSGFEPVTSSARRAFRMFVRETVPAPVN